MPQRSVPGIDQRTSVPGAAETVGSSFGQPPIPLRGFDHGDGLISMYFHLSEIKVKAGQEVKKGDTVGLVGTTGRSTGAHLFFGVRWHNARINPQFLLEKPDKIPSVEPQAASATSSTRN